MIVRFYHPGLREVVTHEFALCCPQCGVTFEPAQDEVQTDVGAPITVHCTACGAHVRSWAPPPESPEPEPELEP